MGHLPGYLHGYFHQSAYHTLTLPCGLINHFPDPFFLSYRRLRHLPSRSSRIFPAISDCGSQKIPAYQVSVPGKRAACLFVHIKDDSLRVAYGLAQFISSAHSYIFIAFILLLRETKYRLVSNYSSIINTHTQIIRILQHRL